MEHEILVHTKDTARAKAAVPEDGYHNPNMANISVKVYYSDTVSLVHDDNLTWIRKDVS